ncbi:MFS general substrate transporter, partial [Rhizodiscina lignyota]
IVLILLAFFILAIGLGDELIQPAQTRVFEAIICRKFYDVHDPSVISPGEHNGWWDDGSKRGVLLGIHEKWCKVPQVQGELAMLKGWDTGLGSIGSLFLAIPWGWFADCYGRKPLVVMLSVAFWLKAVWMQLVSYFWQTFEIKLVWVSALHSLLGGSSAVASAVVFTVVTDVTTETERTAAYFRIGAASMTAMFVSPPISSFLMDRNPWIAMLIGLGIMIIPIPCTLLLPETLKYKPAPPPTAVSSTPEIEPDDPIWKRYFKAAWHVIHDSFAFLSSDLRLFFLVTAFMLHMLFIVGIKDVLLQFGSIRYDLSLAKSTLLLSIRAGLNLVLMLFVLPAFSNYLNCRPAFSVHPTTVDLILARASVTLQAIGFFILALAVNLPWFIIGLLLNTSGWGLMVYVRSLAISMVEPHAVARLYALMSVMDTVGMMVGSPSLAGLFEAGVNWGGLWTGLPFLMCAILAAVVGI